jgi:hypothetical protein
MLKILECVGSNFVFNGVNITPTYRKPFDVLAERSSNKSWLPGSNPLHKLSLFSGSSKSGETGAFVLTESAGRTAGASVTAIMRETDPSAGTRSAIRVATARSSFRILRPINRIGSL